MVQEVNIFNELAELLLTSDLLISRSIHELTISFKLKSSKSTKTKASLMIDRIETHDYHNLHSHINVRTKPVAIEIKFQTRDKLDRFHDLIRESFDKLTE